MEVPKIIILLCCTYYGFASEHVHTIPVENYETDLENLGEHVEIPETPVRLVKITKTVAVKIPVPYPVKVIEKVPYPVHINKPYPVPVPQIIKVPHVVTPGGHQAHEAIGIQGTNQNDHQLGHQGNSYQVQELHGHEEAPNGDSYVPESQSYNGGGSSHGESFSPYNDYSSEGSPRSSYDVPSQSYYGGSSPDADSFESINYDQAIKEYLSKMNKNGNNVGHNYYK